MKLTHSASSRMRLLAIPVVAALALAACGDDSDDDSAEPEATSDVESPTTTGASATTTEPTDTPASTSGTAPASTAADASEPTTGDAGAGPADESLAPIVIGVAAPLTGPFSAVSGAAVDVASAWASWVNAEQGGIKGHPVEIIAKDTKSDPAAATAVLTELVEQDGAIAMVVADAAVEAPMATYLSEQNVPVIGAIGNTADVWSSYPNYRTTFGLTGVTTRASLVAVQAAGVPNFSAMVCAEVPVCAELDGAYQALAGNYGVEYEGYLTAAATAPSFTAECLTMIDKGVGAIVLGLGAATIQGVARDCAQQGYDGYFGIASTSVSASSFAETAGLKAIGAINQFPWWSTAEPVQQYRDVVAEYGNGANAETPAATGTWASLELFRTTMAGAGDAPTSADVLAAYGSIENETLDGLLPAPVTFVEGEVSPDINCTWLYSYENGEFATLTSGEPGNGVEGDLQSSCIP